MKNLPNRAKAILLAIAFGLFFVSFLVVGGALLFYKGVIWNYWWIVSVLFAILVAWQVNSTVRKHVDSTPKNE